MTPPYQFYRSSRLCPECRSVLLTAAPLNRTFTQGILHRLGITCYCVRCNSRYRATGWLRYRWIWWAGPIGRWIWWQTATLELTLSPL